jgi:AcrR family transcriptional regulator
MSTTLETVLVRALSPQQEEAGDAMSERILDAALERVAAFGLRRTTMDDVAEAAGVGRMTVFRRFGTKDALMEVLAVREARRFLDAIDSVAGDIEDPVERMVETAVVALLFANSNPLLGRLSRLEPETVLGILRADNPPLMSIARAYAKAQLQKDREAFGHIDLDLVAEALVRLALSFILVPGGPVPLDDEDATREFARAALVPLLHG